MPAEKQKIFLTLVADDWVKLDREQIDKTDGAIMRGIPPAQGYIHIELQDKEEESLFQEKSNRPTMIGSQCTGSHGQFHSYY